MTKILGVIPARIASTRFPEKVIANLNGKPLIGYVIENALRCNQIDKIIVATDSNKVESIALKYGVETMISDKPFISGSDRVAWVAEQLPEYKYVINIQADEPFLESNYIDLLATSMLKNNEFDIGTLAAHSSDKREYMSDSVVKIVIDKKQRALYFSRSPIPFNSPNSFLQHIGIYAYKREALMRLSSSKKSAMEKSEKLEQLRALEEGYSIRVEIIYPIKKMISIDTKEELEEAEAIILKEQNEK